MLGAGESLLLASDKCSIRDSAIEISGVTSIPTPPRAQKPCAHGPKPPATGDGAPAGCFQNIIVKFYRIAVVVTVDGFSLLFNSSLGRGVGKRGKAAVEPRAAF